MPITMAKKIQEEQERNEERETLNGMIQGVRRNLQKSKLKPFDPILIRGNEKKICGNFKRSDNDNLFLADYLVKNITVQIWSFFR